MARVMLPVQDDVGEGRLVTRVLKEGTQVDGVLTCVDAEMWVKGRVSGDPSREDISGR